MNIILCGMMGAGKSSVGRAVAEMTGMRWVDTDAIIEKENGKIADIFARFGEEHFRSLEREVAERLAKEDGLVISTGGGLVLREENVLKLKQNGRFLYLRAQPNTLYERLSFDGTRPLLKDGEGAREKLKALLAEREPFYECAADAIIDTDDLTVEEAAQEVVKMLKGAGE